MMREKNLKALVHGVLAAICIAEAFDCRTCTRKFVTGCAAGWHINATFYHLFLEKEEVGQKISLDKEYVEW